MHRFGASRFRGMAHKTQRGRELRWLGIDFRLLLARHLWRETGKEGRTGSHPSAQCWGSSGWADGPLSTSRLPKEPHPGRSSKPSSFCHAQSLAGSRGLHVASAQTPQRIQKAAGSALGPLCLSVTDLTSSIHQSHSHPFSLNKKLNWIFSHWLSLVDSILFYKKFEEMLSSG